MVQAEQENAVIRAVQERVPFVRRPFAEIGEKIGLDEAEVIELLRKWQDQGKLREISAILEGAALGYESALVAARVPAADLDRVVGILNAHPTITHNYLRDHAYNLWYTIASPLEPGLDAMVLALSRLTSVEFHTLRRTHTFKIGVNFDLRTRQNRTDASPLATVEPVELCAEAVRLFRALQTPAPIVQEPFDELECKYGIELGALIAFGQRHQGGAVRRYVGTLRHRKLGVRANAMVVWTVAENDIDAAGAKLAQAPEVSHCYARNAIEGFPYRLYSMIHGPDLDDCQQVARRLADELGVADYRLLVSLEEFKKTRLRYFLPELDQWWHAHGGH